MPIIKYDLRFDLEESSKMLILYPKYPFHSIFFHDQNIFLKNPKQSLLTIF